MIKRMGVRSEIPDATFNLVGDRVIPVIVLVHAFQKGADLALVLHLKDCDPDLRCLIVRRSKVGDLAFGRFWDRLPADLFLPRL